MFAFVYEITSLINKVKYFSIIFFYEYLAINSSHNIINIHVKVGTCLNILQDI